MPTRSAIVDELDSAPPSQVVPDRPDAPGVPFPRVAEDAHDAELEAIAQARSAPAARTIFVLRVFSLLASLALAFALRHDLRYALSSHTPAALESTASAAELEAAAHHYVSMRGIPGGVGAVDYRRPMSDALYRLAPLVDRPDIYVELRLPEGVDPGRFVPPTSVSGRLVPFDEAGARFANARQLVTQATGHAPPAKAYLLEEGAAPTLRSGGAGIAAIALGLAALQAAILVGGRRRRA